VIHPVVDGNGRVGRLLIPLMLVLRDALPRPLLYL
jgi:Fic family protein